jgi:hypothetical protein
VGNMDRIGTSGLMGDFFHAAAPLVLAEAVELPEWLADVCSDGAGDTTRL